MKLLKKEAWICIALFIVAFAVRLPYLFDVPRFIDEWREVGLAAQIARGEVWPLHNTSHDIGPLHNYVLAGLFKAFGHSLYIPRLYVTTLSAFTVVITYWIARQWLSTRLSLVAALLLATNSMHILVTHMAWSNDTTPFFVSLAVLLTLRSLGQKKLSSWAWAGVVWALALQSHPSVIAAIVGVLLIIWREERLKTFFLALILGYSNMIVHNILTPLDSILWVKRKDYALYPEWSLKAYFMNIYEMANEFFRSLSSAFPNGDGWTHLVSMLVFIVFVIAFIEGTRKLWSSNGGSLVISIIVLSFLVIPLLNDQYKFYVWTRYIAYLFPLGFVIIAKGLQSFIAYILTCSTSMIRQSRRIAAVGLVVTLSLPLYHFYQYAEIYIESGRDNSAEFQAVSSVQSKNSEHAAPVVVDKQVKQAEAVSKMLRVKGFSSPLVGIDPNEVREAVAFNEGGKHDAEFYLRWKRTFQSNDSDTWYILSLSNKEKLTKFFHIEWRNEEIVQGKGGKQTYFIGQVSSVAE
ncbi:glycosyltransferase family 39 protein [Ammoniphilus sp. YIM 78166]|uniref:ArnT family glycosyltransferase n=1 Tax=Ammoniphilus sp. YIM 78166 TaxID=1644106 RepID=UPI00106F9DE6|nr:glycosyltransferase family 39 protein [Ammoniphilus sp. YIM 78166]